ncbi:MAG TPA: TolC family protein, partial [Leptospiraceae bacterium]|nr:TolC family protein [Leptospiraceae bacterium]
MKQRLKIFPILMGISFPILLNFCRTENIRNEIPAVNSDKKVSEVRKSEPEKKEILSEKKELTFDEIFQIALKNSERMNLKKEMIEEADARKDLAFADLFPSLSYRYQKFFNVPDHTEHDSVIRNRNNAYNAYTGAYATPYNPFYTYSQSDGTSGTTVSPAFRPGSRLVLHIPLFSGGTDWNRYKNTGLEVKMRRLEYRNEFYRFYLETAATVFSIMQMEESLESRKKLKDLSKKMSLELQRRSAIGRSRRSEYLNSITKISRIDAEILNLENMLELKREDLAYLTGIKDKISLKKNQSKETEIRSAEEAEKS